MANKRIDTAIDVLSSGGYFHGFESRDYYGKPEVGIMLKTADHKKVKGVGRQTLLDLTLAGCIRHMDDGNYLPNCVKYRGFIHGYYKMIYGPHAEN